MLVYIFINASQCLSQRHLQVPSSYYYAGIYRLNTTENFFGSHRDGWFQIEHELNGMSITFTLRYL